MKILSVKFMNLNSLKGEHEIRFDKSPISDSGLFAITGPTGSGKTTILDAISVALYGKVHRHGNRNTDEIMTRQTGECYSEVCFEVNGRKYRARWSLARSYKKAGGNMQSPKMELAEMDGRIISDQRLAEVQALIAEICNLDYDQFMKSVMLSQGDFTRFLKSTESERSELLEKITDTQVYSEISAFVYRFARNIEEQLTRIQSSIKAIEPFIVTKEQLAAYRQSIAALMDRVGEEKVKADRLNEQLGWLQNLEKLTLRKQEHEQKIRDLNGQITENQPWFHRLERHRKALPCQPLLGLLDQANERINSLTGKLDNIRTSIPALEEACATLKQSRSEAASKVNIAENNLRNAEPKIEDAIRRDETIRNEDGNCTRLKYALTVLARNAEDQDRKVKEKEQKVGHLRTEINALDAWVSQNQPDGLLGNEIIKLRNILQQMEDGFRIGRNVKNEGAKAEEAREKEVKELAISNNKLLKAKNDLGNSKAKRDLLNSEKTEILSRQSIDDIEGLLKTVPALIHAAGEMESLARQYAGVLDEIARFTLDQSRNISETEQKTTLLKDFKTRLERELITLQDLMKIVELEKTVVRLENLRGQLHDGEPCPLCGSTRHPYVEENHQHNLSEAEKRSNAQEKMIVGLNDDIRRTETTLLGLHHQGKAIRDNLSRCTDSLQDLTKTFTEHNRKLPVTFAITDVEAISRYAQSKTRENTAIAALAGKLKDLDRNIRELDTQIHQDDKTILALEGNIKVTEERIERLAQVISAANGQLQELKNRKDLLVQSAIDLMLPYGIAFSYEARVGIEQDIQARITTFQENQQRQQLLKLSLADVERDWKNSLRNLEDLNRQLAQNKAEYEEKDQELAGLRKVRALLFGDRNPIAERKRLNEDLDQKRKIVEKTTADYNQQLSNLALHQQTLNQGTADLETDKSRAAQLTHELEEKLIVQGFLSIQDLMDSFMAESEARQAEVQHKNLVTQLSSYQGICASITEELEKEKIKNLTSETAVVLTLDLGEVEKETTRINQEIGGIQHKMKSDEEREKEYELLKASETLKITDHKKWQKLSNMIGSENGAKFRKYAQGLTLQRLTEFANRHLLALNDRYTIVKTEEKDLELQVMDGYQADMLRPVNTLSGGESFLVSLALALGLSDMAGRKVQINSLFIDEGFGTLDADTLDVALGALDNLQSNGKVIGVITHVDLKDRISNQVQVTRLSGGFSKLKVVSGGNSFS